MVCPTSIKKEMLLQEEKNQTLHSMKFYTKKEFLDLYYFSYDEASVYYLMKKYHYPVDVAYEYLGYLYSIEEKEYSSKKLNFLRDLKKELMDNHLLTIHSSFQKKVEKSSICTSHIYHIDPFLSNVLPKVEFNSRKIQKPVYEFNSLEEEVHFVCVKIRELVKKGIPFKNIVLCNVSEDYYYSLAKIFSYYKIPIMIPFHNSLYSTKIVQDYLKTGELDLEHPNSITKQICSILQRVVSLEDDEVRREILIYLLKNASIPNPSYQDVVEIKELDSTPFQEDQYVFVLGFNQDALPRIEKDIEFLSDAEKQEIGLSTSYEWNKEEKEVVRNILSNIQNLTLSYKLSSPFSKYYPSSFIEEEKLEVLHEEVNDIEYSDLYNKIRFEEALDGYYLYGEKNGNFLTFSKYYDDEDYSSYSHEFQGIDLDTYLKNLSYPLRLSYTALNTYNECGFKYYIQYVLKLGDYEDTFAAIVGSLYHEILSIYKKSGFDLDYAWNHYLETKDLSLKDTVLLVRIRKDLEELLKVLREQDTYTGFDQEYYEKELKVRVRDDILVEFIGYVDKIMVYQKISDTYFSIVDYKTGTIDTHIEPMKYGLHMQLPIYLYLIHNSKVFDNPIFTGIYYQNILFSYPTWREKLAEEKRDQYKLKGYSTDNIDALERFDSTYQDSSLIKGMKYDSEKGFSRFSKILSDEMVYKLVEYTKKEIEKDTDKILKGEFSIHPKIYGKENVSCKYCKFHDLCFVRDSDSIYLDKVEDFSFLDSDFS